MIAISAKIIAKPYVKTSGFAAFLIDNLYVMVSSRYSIYRELSGKNFCFSFVDDPEVFDDRASSFVLMFDLSNLQTLEALKTDICEINQGFRDTVPIVLIGLPHYGIKQADNEEIGLAVKQFEEEFNASYFSLSLENNKFKIDDKQGGLNAFFSRLSINYLKTKMLDIATRYENTNNTFFFGRFYPKGSSIMNAAKRLREVVNQSSSDDDFSKVVNDIRGALTNINDDNFVKKTVYKVFDRFGAGFEEKHEYPTSKRTKNSSFNPSHG